MANIDTRKQPDLEAFGAWEVQTDRIDAIELIEEQSATRVPELVSLRYERMGASPFTFFRGTAIIMAHDLATQPVSGIEVQCIGDAHIANFGVFSSPTRHLVFDVNDFDETAPGPWEWDIKRLAASVEICGRDRGFAKKDRRDAVRACAKQYCRSLCSFAKMGELDVWYAHLDVEQALDEFERDLHGKTGRTVRRAVEKARQKDNQRAADKLAHRVGDALRFNSQPPELVPLSDLEALQGYTDGNELFAALQELLDSYLASLPYDRRMLLEHYHVHDAARKVVGVGSVGTRCWVAAFSGNQMADPLVLQIKEANASVLEQFCGRSPYLSHGERVVAGQRLMQTTSGVLLGWTHARDERGRRRDYYVRQLWNWKMSVDLDHASADELEIYSQLCAWVLARAHARTGDRVAMASYLGTSDKFDASMVSFALAYADQNEADYEQFLKRIAVS